MEIVNIEEFKESFADKFVEASTEFTRPAKQKDLKNLVSKVQKAGALPFELEKEEEKIEWIDQNPLLTENNELIDLDIPETFSQDPEEENQLHKLHMLQSLQALQYMKTVEIPPLKDI